MDDRRPDEELCERIWEVVCAIPAGHVATYGQVADLAGAPGAARHAGRCLSGLPEQSGVPWHRVINAQGRISISPSRGGHDELQRELLVEEGVEFSPSGRVDLGRYRWLS